MGSLFRCNNTDCIRIRKHKIRSSYTYTAKNKNKLYKEQEIVEFKDYSGFLIYISEIDEMRNEIKKLGNNLKKLIKHFLRHSIYFLRKPTWKAMHFFLTNIAKPQL